ncbi:tetratricopeptide repeat protein [Marispirochaeta sp.]|jgi:tetratricopeptide (TPR) repeat protein|uniref:tetratricopeptide repeat protein n=1 Tax=Marispirochaeta sp. TaxID=2038653 RepID=UPI0029C8F209|nr:tetratricopeptide repeat protein [Marispirochaeta sp.]
MSTRSVFLVFCLLLLSSFSWAQEDQPDWLILESGKIAFERGEYGEAMRIFRSVLEQDRVYPEAHYWIGRIFEEEGEYSLAEAQYKRALDFRRQLYVMGYEISIRERLARLYKERGNYAEFERALTGILDMDDAYSGRETEAMKAAMVRVLTDQGLEKVVELYRLDRAEYFLAHAELGLFYYRTGRYMDAVRHLLSGGLTVISRTIQHMEVSRPFLEYTNLTDLFRNAMTGEESAVYLEQSRIDALLYYLGAALYASGEPGSFRQVMELVRDAFPGSDWRSRAIAQLADPSIEPVITSREFFYFF